MSNFLGRISTKLLLAAEKFYLRAHGWIQIGPDSWDSPLDYQFKRRLGIRQGHAVNSQKQNLYKDLGARLDEQGIDDLKTRLGLKKRPPVRDADTLDADGNN